MPRSITDMLCMSLELDEAAEVLSGESIDTLVVFKPTEAIVKYTGKLLIHTVGFLDESEADAEQKALLKEIRENTLEILKMYGLTPETFPGWAIQGWVNVTQVFPYDTQKFALEKDRHGLGENLTLYAAENGLMGEQAWGIRFNKAYTITPPVEQVIPPEGTGAGDVWLANNPLLLEAFKMTATAPIQETEAPEEDDDEEFEDDDLEGDGWDDEEED